MAGHRSRWKEVLDAYDTVALLVFTFLSVIAAACLYMLVQLSRLSYYAIPSEFLYFKRVLPF